MKLSEKKKNEWTNYEWARQAPSLIKHLLIRPTTNLQKLLCPWGLSRQENWNGLPCPPTDLPNPGIKTRSPELRADSVSSEPPGKPKNTGMGSLPLLQGIFPTRNSNGVSCIASGFFTSWVTRDAHRETTPRQSPSNEKFYSSNNPTSLDWKEMEEEPRVIIEELKDTSTNHNAKPLFTF